MKKQLINSLIIELVLVLLSVYHMCFVTRFRYGLILGVLLLITIIVTVLNKDTKKDLPYSKDIVMISLIYILMYYVITYLIGFFFGFVYTTYSRSLKGMLYNVITAGILITLIEQLRGIVITKGKYYKSVMVLSIVTFTLVEATTFLSFSNDISRVVIFEVLLSTFLPCLSLNVLLTYLTYKTNKNSSLLIHIIYSLPTYIVPVFPDLGDYFRTLLLVILPLINIATIYFIFYEKRNKIKDTREYIKSIRVKQVISIVSFIILAVIIYFVSGIGRLSSFAIGSESMTGVINKGDIAIIDKEYDKKFKVGDIIAFDQNGKTIVHRIVDIKINKDGTFYITKGDFNNGVDDWLVTGNQIVGIYKFRIIGLGWPTVSLSEFIKK